MLKVYYQFKRYDKDQSLKSRSRKKLSRSFVKQFLQIMYINFESGGSVSINDCGLTARTSGYRYPFNASHPGGICYVAAYYSSTMGFNAARSGIIVGTGTGAVAMTDAYMGTIIPNGTGSGELEYLSCAVYNYTESDPNASFVLERLFRNGSGDTVSINEVGVACGDNSWPFLIIRDLVSPAEDVADGEYLKITYTFQIEA